MNTPYDHYTKSAFALKNYMKCDLPKNMKKSWLAIYLDMIFHDINKSTYLGAQTDLNYGAIL